MLNTVKLTPSILYPNKLISLLRTSVVHEIEIPHARERDLTEQIKVNRTFDFGCAVELALFTVLIVLFNFLTGQRRKTRVLIENLFDFRGNLYHRFSKYGMIILSAKLFFMFYRLFLGNSIKTMCVKGHLR